MTEEIHVNESKNKYLSIIEGEDGTKKLGVIQLGCIAKIIRYITFGSFYNNTTIKAVNAFILDNPIFLKTLSVNKEDLTAFKEKMKVSKRVDPLAKAKVEICILRSGVLPIEEGDNKIKETVQKALPNISEKDKEDLINFCKKIGVHTEEVEVKVDTAKLIIDSLSLPKDMTKDTEAEHSIRNIRFNPDFNTPQANKNLLKKRIEELKNTDSKEFIKVGRQIKEIIAAVDHFKEYEFLKYIPSSFLKDYAEKMSGDKTEIEKALQWRTGFEENLEALRKEGGTINEQLIKDDIDMYIEEKRGSFVVSIAEKASTKTLKVLMEESNDFRHSLRLININLYFKTLNKIVESSEEVDPINKGAFYDLMKAEYKELKNNNKSQTGLANIEKMEKYPKLEKSLHWNDPDFWLTPEEKAKKERDKPGEWVNFHAID